MGEDNAMRLALDLLHVPSRVHYMRSVSLPDGMELLLRVAAGEPDAVDQAGAMTLRNADTLRAAAAFFVEQVLLADDADSYRVLGASAFTSAADLRRHMALLVRHFHPDVATREQDALFAGRVTKAWENVKTPERRAEYDLSHQQEMPRGGPRVRRNSRSRAAGRAAAAVGIMRTENGIGHHLERTRPGWLQRLLQRLLPGMAGG